MQPILTYGSQAWTMAIEGMNVLRIFETIILRKIYKKKGKSVPLQAWGGPEGSRSHGPRFHDNGTGRW